MGANQNERSWATKTPFGSPQSRLPFAAASAAGAAEALGKNADGIVTRGYWSEHADYKGDPLLALLRLREGFTDEINRHSREIGDIDDDHKLWQQLDDVWRAIR